MEPLRVAIVGAAGTWGRYYLHAYAEHPDVTLIAVCDRVRPSPPHAATAQPPTPSFTPSPSHPPSPHPPATYPFTAPPCGQAPRIREFARSFGVPKVFATVEELLADEVPDIVSAVVPVAHNYAVVAACAEAGVRVVSCEKPIHFSLEEADALVELCRGKGCLFGCGMCHWEAPHSTDIFRWVADNLGEITAASVPRGCPTEVSGGSCPQLAAIRLLCGMEVSWVEGWVMEPVPTYEALPEGRPAHEADCPAYGRLGFANGATCTIPPPPSGDDEDPVPFLTVEGTGGRAWLGGDHPVLIKGVGGGEHGRLRPEAVLGRTVVGWAFTPALCCRRAACPPGVPRPTCTAGHSRPNVHNATREPDRRSPHWRG